MDKSERFLAVYQKTNAICISSDSESSSSGHDLYKDVPKLLSDFSYQQKHCDNIGKFFEEYLKEKHTEKDVKLLHGVYSNKEITHAEIKELHSQKSLHSQLYEDIWESNNEISHSSEENPELLPPILERVDEFNRSHMILSRFLNPAMNNQSVESKNEIEMPHISGRIKLNPIQFLELPPIKTQRINSPT